MSDGTAFGLWLKQRRTQLGLTLQDLAEHAGCSTVLIRKIEAGERKPADAITLALARLFGVPADEQPAFLAFAQAHLPAAALPALPATAERAPWRTLYSRAIHLPTPATAFIGRADAVAAACAVGRAPRTRLLTLLGPPGIGKTRLGLRVAETLAPGFPDGVYFVGLAAIRDPSLVPGAIARALDVRERGGEPLIAALTGYLQPKRLLLVLDNFEQVIPASLYVATLLGAAPRLTVLATSRQPLQVRGERQFRLQPLTMPAAEAAADCPAEELARYEAVQLFVERAAAVHPEFALAAENAAAVVALCRDLDQLPLAIELAAARARRLSPQEMLATLRQHLPGGGVPAPGADPRPGGRMRLLADGPRDLTPRQQTLRGAIDWSYDLLDADEQHWFRALAVFTGGCAPAAVQAVVGGAGEVTGILQALAGKSLLQEREGGDGAPRFWMLETIREYAREKLEAGGQAPALDRAHALYYTGLAEEAEPHLLGAGQQEWMARLEVEYDNIGGALQWARTQGVQGQVEAAEIALRLAGAFWRFWYVRGYISEGREQLDGALAAAAGALGLSAPGTLPDPANPPAERRRAQQALAARVFNGGGALATRHGDYPMARAQYEQSLALREALGDRKGVGGSLNNLGGVAHLQGEFDRAWTLFVQSLAIKRESGDQRGVAYALNSLGTVAFSTGDNAAAARYFQESLEIKQALGDQAGAALSVDNLGLVAYEARDYAGARAFHEQSLAMRRELGDKWGIAKTLDNLGNVAYREGAYATARALYAESLALYREQGDRLGIIEILEGFARLAGAQQQVLHAARLWGAAEAFREIIRSPIQDNDRLRFDAEVAAARAAVAAETFRQAWQAGRGLTQEAAIALALARPRGAARPVPATRRGRAPAPAQAPE